MRLLHIIGTLDPAWGGPAEAVRQIASAVSDQGHTVEIVTLDTANDWFANDKGIVVQALGPSLGRYRLNDKLIPWLMGNAQRFDMIVCHGIWQYQSLATWLASRLVRFRYCVFVHGALDPWLRYAYPLKHMKKWLYWQLAEHNALRSAEMVLYTSEDERELAAKSFRLFKGNGVVVPYGISAPAGAPNRQKEAFYDAFPDLRGSRILLFMGRVHPKKGCDLLIEAFAAISERRPRLHLVVAGPDEANWVPSLKGRAQELGVQSRITWTGMLTGDLKWGALHAASCFVLPSHSENFARAVVESLACGVPVIITNKINIWREIQEEGAGFVGEDTLAATIGSLLEWLELSDADDRAMRENARTCFWRHFEINSCVKDYIGILRAVSTIGKA